MHKLASISYTAMYLNLLLVIVAFNFTTSTNAAYQQETTKIIAGYDGTCPPEEVRIKVRQDITTTVKRIISDIPPCGGNGWRRIAFLNMSDDTQMCPSVLNEITSPVRSCGRPSNAVGCYADYWSTGDTKYSQVCGRIVAYQVDTTDGFNIDLEHNGVDGSDINSVYVDGISLTHGNPRQHIWTFAAGSNEQGDIYGCYCNGSSAGALRPPMFVGDNYFCESARHELGYTGGFFLDDPLWDGENCVVASCCEFNTPPWFVAHLPNPTMDDIEFRLCFDEGGENVAIQLIEMYII